MFTTRDIADYFKASDNQSDPDKLLEKWRDLWSMSDLLTTANYKNIFRDAGFGTDYEADVTLEITPTAKRMYWSYLLGGPLAVIYNTFFNASKFARTHYKLGLYQYKALKEGLWNYSMIMFVKTE